MNTAGDAAEQVVKMSLNGVEVVANISGSAAKELALMLFAALRKPQKTKGKTRLTNMLKSEKPLKVFAVKNSALQRFCKEAKKYGILYSVLKDRNASDGLTDIMVRAEDAAKVNRIFERFNLAPVDVGEITGEIERKRQDSQPQQSAENPTSEKAPAEEQKESVFDLLTDKSRHIPEEQVGNPTEGRIAKSRQSEPISTIDERSAGGAPEYRPSVREELKKIRSEQEQMADRLPKNKSKQQATKHHQNPGRTNHKQRKAKHKKTKER